MKPFKKRFLCRLRIALLLFSLSIIFSACTKEGHTIRFRNAYHLTVSNVIVGSVVFGEVLPAKITSYRSIETGDFEITGNTSNGLALRGGGSVTGRGRHNWTITLNSSGLLSINEDK